MRWSAAYAVLGLVLSGCAAGSHATTASTPPASPTPVSRPGGLIGVIDTARLTAVCADAQQAETVVQGGAPSAATDSLTAAAALLERPPVDPAAAATAVTIRRELRAGHPDAAVAAALAFCRAHR